MQQLQRRAIRHSKIGHKTSKILAIFGETTVVKQKNVNLALQRITFISLLTDFRNWLVWPNLHFFLLLLLWFHQILPRSLTRYVIYGLQLIRSLSVAVRKHWQKNIRVNFLEDFFYLQVPITALNMQE